MKTRSASAKLCASGGESQVVPLSETPVAASLGQLSEETPVAASTAQLLVETTASTDEGQTANHSQATDENDPPSKKAKTSEVWQYYDDIWVTNTGPDGVEVREQWAKCKKCDYKGNKNTTRGTTVFWNHMKNKHHLVKGQQKLVGSDGTMQTYRYDTQASLKKWQLCMVMHEYSFKMVEHEYLAVQVSTVASESAFSAGGRVLDSYRSRLDPEMVEALICIKDWTLASKEGFDAAKDRITALRDESDMEVDYIISNHEGDTLVET